MSEKAQPGRKVYCRAVGRIPYGARVLVRAMRAEVAGPEMANGTAQSAPSWWRGHKRYKDGESLVVAMDATIGARDLHAIANGPIMDANELYLPAGKISMAEYRERQRSILNPEGDPS